jgi:hypothetical protein
MDESFVKYHDELSGLMARYKGRTLITAEIAKLFEEAYPELDVRFMQPSDHCINHTPTGACSECKKAGKAIFERLKRATYKVL